MCCGTELFDVLCYRVVWCVVVQSCLMCCGTGVFDVV